jgi:hypothetical protein
MDNNPQDLNSAAQYVLPNVNSDKKFPAQKQITAKDLMSSVLKQ